jgi:DNA-binding MarR family transcriptional regulator
MHLHVPSILMQMHGYAQMPVMDKKEPHESVISAWTRLIRAEREVLGAVEADLKSAGFPPLAWYDVLLELRRAEPQGLRPMELERELLLPQSNVSRLLDRMEQRGLIRKSPAEDDGRGFKASITTQGQALLKRMWPAYRGAIAAHVGDKLTREESARLAELLGKLLLSSEKAAKT